MPVVARSDEYRVDVGPGQQFEKITIAETVGVAVMGIDHFFDLGRPAALNVAISNELHVLFRQHDAQIILAARPQT